MRCWIIRIWYLLWFPAPRSVVENLEASDFTVTADMENIDATMSMVPIIVSAASNSSQIDITQRNSFLIVAGGEPGDGEFPCGCGDRRHIGGGLLCG